MDWTDTAIAFSRHIYRFFRFLLPSFIPFFPLWTTFLTMSTIFFASLVRFPPRIALDNKTSIPNLPHGKSSSGVNGGDTKRPTKSSRAGLQCMSSVSSCLSPATSIVFTLTCDHFEADNPLAT